MGLTICHTQQLSASICDCEGATHLNAIQVPEDGCLPPKALSIRRPVRYTVYTSQPEAKKISGVMCSRWKHVRHITTTFFFQTVEVPEHIAIDTPKDECVIMKTRRTCDTRAMDYKDGKWTYSDPPVGARNWMRTTEAVEINCMMEEVTLLLDYEDSTLTTPIGKVDASTGAYSHNHVTVIWDQLVTKHTPGQIYPIDSGTGQLITTSVPNRIIDHENQADYHLVPISCNITNCPKVYKVIGSNQLTIEINGPGSPPPDNFPYGMHLNFRSLIQFHEDRLIDMTNTLASHVRVTQCDLRKLRYAQATTTAQYNGWLAAAQLNLPTCTKLIASGSVLMVLRCNQRNITFSTEITRCGPQLRYKNKTLSLDGWELAPYSPCYSSLGFVNINGMPHVHHNHSWEPMETENIQLNSPLSTTFRYIDVMLKPHHQHKNPAYADTMTSHMNMVADIIASLNEQTSGDLSEQSNPKSRFDQLHQINNLSMFDQIYLFLSLFVAILIFLVLLRIAYAIGLHTLIWKLCCKPQKNEYLPPAEIIFPSAPAEEEIDSEA